MGESLYVGIHARMTLKQHAIIKVVDFVLKRKKNLILTKLMLVLIQKSTTFINICCFSVNLLPALH